MSTDLLTYECYRFNRHYQGMPHDDLVRLFPWAGVELERYRRRYKVAMLREQIARRIERYKPTPPTTTSEPPVEAAGMNIAAAAEEFEQVYQKGRQFPRYAGD